MKILHLDSQLIWRGGENQLFLLLEELIRRGHDVAVACPAGTRLARDSIAAGAAHVAWRPRCEWDLIAGAKLKRFVREWRPDVIHAHDSRSVSFIGGCKDVPACRIAHRRVDFRINSNRKYIKKADRVIAISRAIERIMVTGGIPKDRIVLIHSGINPARFKDRPSRDAARRTLQIPENKKLILSVGALTHHKAHDTGIDAYAALCKERNDVEWWIAGDGELKNRLIARSGEYGFYETGRVRFIGKRDDVPALLSAADVFYHPSRLEGLGTAILEAMCCRLPVVASNIGGIPEAVQDGKTGYLVNTDDPEDHARALLKMLDDPEWAGQLGENGKTLFDAEFTSAVMADKITSLYHELRDSACHRSEDAADETSGGDLVNTAAPVADASPNTGE